MKDKSSLIYRNATEPKKVMFVFLTVIRVRTVVINQNMNWTFVVHSGTAHNLDTNPFKTLEYY